MNKEMLARYEKAIVDLQPHMSVDGQANVAMMMILVEEIRCMRTDLQNLQEQFDRVSGGGHALKVYHD